MSSEDTEMVLTDRIQEIKEEAASESDLKEEENDPFVQKDRIEEEKEVKDEIGQLSIMYIWHGSKCVQNSSDSLF